MNLFFFCFVLMKSLEIMGLIRKKICYSIPRNSIRCLKRENVIVMYDIQLYCVPRKSFWYNFHIDLQAVLKRSQ